MSAKELMMVAKKELLVSGVRVSRVTLFARHAMQDGDLPELFELHARYVDEDGNKAACHIANESAAEVIRLFRRDAIPAIERATKSRDSEAAKSPLEEAIAYFEGKLEEMRKDSIGILVVEAGHARELTAAAKEHLATQR